MMKTSRPGTRSMTPEEIRAFAAKQNAEDRARPPCQHE